MDVYLNSRMNGRIIARKDIVDNQTSGFYHCTNRYVHRTFLCGIDELTGQIILGENGIHHIYVNNRAKYHSSQQSDNA